MTKKKESKKKEESKFDLDEALSNVNPYLKPGFTDFIRGEKVTTQKQFDKLYNDYKEFR